MSDISRIGTQELDDTALDGVSGGVTVDVSVLGHHAAGVNSLAGVASPLAAHGVDLGADGNSLVDVNVTF